MARILNAFRAGFFYLALVILTLCMALAAPLLWIIGVDDRAIARSWLRHALFLIRHVCGITYAVRGQIPKAPCIFAVQHQSAWETFVLTALLDMPAIVLKKELLSIPIFGRYLRYVGMVPIDRSAGRKALSGIRLAAKEALDAKRHVIIFPEGTRVKYGARGRIQSGVAALYEASLAPIVPVTLDSGRLWPRNSFLKKPGVITVQFHSPLPKKLARREVTQALETLYYGNV